jgi:hypothetical protein
MKQTFFSPVFKQLIALFFLFFLLTQHRLAAQNVSYNANSVPISGTNCTAIGVQALSVNSGGFSTATGYQALFSNTTGDRNTANGALALYSNTDGFDNTANGENALYSNTTGFQNTANGSGALTHNTTGYNNTASGTGALMGTTTGSFNSASGMFALINNITGNGNTANGYVTLSQNSTGYNNVALGDSAGYSSLGSGNLYLGSHAGAYETGSNKMYIGNNETNTLIYGDFASRQILLGVPDATGYTFKGSRTLNVVHGVLTDSVRVALSSAWADFVFDDSYTLMPLDKLGGFIQNHKHLPGIPSAAEVAVNGIELGEMNSKLLQKIEELTLYTLQQQKKNEEQQKKNEELQQQNESVQKRFDEQQKQIDELKKLLLVKQ